MTKSNNVLIKILIAVFVVSVFVVGSIVGKPKQSTPVVSSDSETSNLEIATVGIDKGNGVEGPVGKIPLKVLYVGLTGTKRFEAFNQLLSDYFEQAATADYNTFNEEQTGGFDAVIFDYDGVKWQAMSIKVSKDYSKPTVTVGVPGAFWCENHSLKNGYM